MTNTQLIILYIFGWAASIYIGMRIEHLQWAKRSRRDMDQAYYRGWNNGKDFNKRIITERDELNSAVRILTGDIWDDEER